jgi:hypothetical protein
MDINQDRNERGKAGQLALGVTGHRFLAEIEKVIHGIDRALDRIEARYEMKNVRLISSLAEGADQLVVNRVMTRWEPEIIVPLPFPEREYTAQFSSQQAQGEFQELLNHASQVFVITSSGSPEDAYAAAGYYVLERCQILIAVWDGKHSLGKGGTGDIVREARKRRKPIAWVHAGNRIPGTQEPTSLGIRQGDVTIENFPE